MSVSFNAALSAQHITYGDVTYFNNNYSISMWIRFTAGQTAFAPDLTFISKADASFNGFRFYFDAVLGANVKRLRWYVKDTTGVSDKYSDELGAGDEEVWMHVVLQWNDTTNVAAFYLDGVEQTNTTTSACLTSFNNASDFTIGNQPTSVGRWGHGHVGHVSVFDSVISLGIIGELVAGTDPMALTAGMPAPTPVFFASYELESQAGMDIVGDVFPTAHTATPDNTLEPTLLYTTQHADEAVIVLMPDTQAYAAGTGTAHWASQTTWIKEHFGSENAANNEKIVFAGHLGDIVNTPTIDAEWDVARTALDILNDNNVPFAVLPGNHDWLSETQTNRNKDEYNNATRGFPPAYFSGKPWYIGPMVAGDNSNNVCQFSGAGLNWLALSVEFAPNTATLEWIQAQCVANPARHVIIFTHDYQYIDSTGSADAQDARHDTTKLGVPPAGQISPTGHIYGGDDPDIGIKHLDPHDGEEMWQDYLKDISNLTIVASAHICGDGQGYRFDTATSGQVVHQFMQNFQPTVTGTAEGGFGRMILLRLCPSEGRIYRISFSPDPQNNSHYWFGDDDIFFNTFDFTAFVAPATDTDDTITDDTIQISSHQSDATPLSRTTHLEVSSTSGLSEVEWILDLDTPDISSAYPAILRTSSTGITNNYSNIIASTLNSIDIWLPPTTNYRLRVRKRVNGSWESWSTYTEFTSPGYNNSYQRYRDLSGL